MMSGSQHIRFIARQQIYIQKWDECISKAGNGLIYAYSFYLDHMAKHWDALVYNDYEAVMPLTWNRKYGIAYLYQPFLTAQLGVFGQRFNPNLVNDFIQAIPTSFRFIDISLNSGNSLPDPRGFSVNRSNYVLDMGKSYEELYKAYRENIQRNIRKAQQAGCQVQKNFDVERVIDLALRQMKGYSKGQTENVNHFRKLYEFLHDRQMATTYGILSEQNEWLATGVFFYSPNRAYYILVGNHPAGKTTGASHALIDAFIKDHAGKSMVLDFEGSDIPNLALFYSGFGAIEEKYPAIRLNRLPFYLKWLKGN